MLTWVCEDDSVVLENSGSLVESTPKGLTPSPSVWGSGDVALIARDAVLAAGVS
jgi:hypothetical protein